MTVREIPFDVPTDKSVVPEPRVLTDEQKSQYEEVLAEISKLETIPAQGKLKQDEPLTDRDRAWLSEECILRYLRATKWNTAHSIKRILSTLAWRHSFGVDPHTTLTSKLCSQENETGKEVILGWDNAARPCLYLRPGLQNTKASHTQVQHLVFMLERVIDFMVPGQDQLALVIDFHGVGMRKRPPSLSTGREVLSILQDHYPERLGKALLTNLPGMARVFLKLIHPFIDPLTREKLAFEEPLLKYIPEEQLMKIYGGDVDFEYNHEAYWAALEEMALSRNDYYHKRWEENSVKIGHSESELRKGYHSRSKTESTPKTDLENPIATA